MDLMEFTAAVILFNTYSSISQQVVFTMMSINKNKYMINVFEISDIKLM